MSEKLDGIRAYWDGKNLFTRQNKKINAPEYFTRGLPQFALDGELWSKRGDFENIQAAVMDANPGGMWKEIKYMLFEAPGAEGNFTDRLQKVRDSIEKKKLRHVEIIEQKICMNQKELDAFLEHVIAKGGEGVMIKDASKSYFDGRSDSILKVKKADDSEAEVVGYKEGSGKFFGMMGSLQLELANGIRFYLGSGFSEEQRKNPPKTGTIVTFRHYGFTKYGKPKFASFMRLRRD